MIISLSRSPYVIFVFLGTLLGCTGKSVKPSEEHQNKTFLATGITATLTKLPNGIRIVTIPRAKSTTISYQTFFNVGSKNEIHLKTGLAHFFEHMMFKGTRLVPEGEFDRQLEAVGSPGSNAYTTQDMTVYVQEIPATLDAIKRVIELEADRLQNLVIDKTSFETEREVVKNERRFRDENSVDGKLYQRLFELSYQTHPYRWPVIGYEMDLNMMSHQDATQFYKHYYRPDRAIIVVVGKFDESQIIPILRERYESIPNDEPEIPAYAKNIISRDPPSDREKRDILWLETQNQKLAIAFKIPELSHADSPTLEVLQAVLSDGKNSRLKKALIHTGLATEVSTGSFGLQDPGLFSIIVETPLGASLGKIEKIIYQELERIKLIGVPEQEIERAKNLIDLQFYQKISLDHGLSEFVGSSLTLLGNVNSGLKQRDQIREVKKEDLQRLMKTYFHGKNRSVVWVKKRNTP